MTEGTWPGGPRPNDPQEGDVVGPTVDRRRFNADGTRVGGDEDPARADEGLDAGGLEPATLPDTVPAAEARMWEDRARAAEAKLAAVAGDFRRARAETEAVRARLERDRDTRVREALGRSFGRILAGLDDLERALEHAPPGDPLADGIRLVHRQFLDALAAEGLERLQVVGEAFDPNVAEAVMTVPAGSPEETQRVIAEIRAGYRLGDRIVRPAQVRVAV